MTISAKCRRDYLFIIKNTIPAIIKADIIGIPNNKPSLGFIPNAGPIFNNGFSNDIILFRGGFI